MPEEIPVKQQLERYREEAKQIMPDVIRDELRTLSLIRSRKIIASIKEQGRTLEEEIELKRIGGEAVSTRNVIEMSMYVRIAERLLRPE